MLTDFSERNVLISHREKIFIVQKLSISHYCEADKLIAKANHSLGKSGTNDSEKIVAVSKKNLWQLLESILPDEIFCDRNCFDYSDTVKLCMHTAFGTYLDDKPEKNYISTEIDCSIPDYKLMASRILSVFSSYKLRELLNEPASIFFSLADYAERVTADKALELTSAGIKAAFGKPESLIAKRGILNFPDYFS